MPLGRNTGMKTVVAPLVALVLGAMLSPQAFACDEKTGVNCLYISAPRTLTPEERRKQELEEERRKEEVRREQQRVDGELARRGWPKSREAEVRQFFELQKSAAAAGPKPGAGSALRDDAPSAGDAQTRWMNSSLAAQAQTQATKPVEQAGAREKDNKKPQRQAFLEAILACSLPDGKGRFRCWTPLDVISGGPNDTQWSTPAAVAAWASASCPGARKLPSTTHAVWGCGFGATNNSNSMDRSGGVDVQGRHTYYCFPKETSCRRTSP
jgi:hypothetical protein